MNLLRLSSSRFCRALLALGCALVGAAAPLSAADAVIAGWNVACGVAQGGGGRIPQERIARVGRIIAEKIRPDLIVLSEVSSSAEARAIAAASAQAGWPLTFRGLPSQPQGCTQFLAVLARPGVSTGRVRTIPGSEATAYPSTRRAIITQARLGRFDCQVVGVHFKSSRGTAERTARTQQCQRVAAHLAQLEATGRERDFLIVGDYNMIPGDDAVNFTALNPRGRLRFLSDNISGGTHVTRCSNGVPSGNKLDGYAIARPETREYVGGTIRKLDHTALGLPCSAFRSSSANYVSDHFPLVARFRTEVDDD